MSCNFVIPILFGFCACMAWVIGYFFVYKQNQAERKYEEKMKKINSIGSGYF